MTASATHLVLIPSYNTGPRLRDVVAEVLGQWRPVLVVIDGSTDGAEQSLRGLASAGPGLEVLALASNAGKGAAALAGAKAALERGFTHALVMDADGQHPAGSIAEFMEASIRHPDALILGKPVFPANIPAERLHGRKLSVGLTRLEVLGRAIPDPLFGFRVYPLAPLLAVLGPRRGGRRYDFDTEAAVRLVWAGVRPRSLAAPVRYFSAAEGGVSHFHYVRDNIGLAWMHTRLIAELLLRRWPALLRRRTTGAALALLLACGAAAMAAEAGSFVAPEHRIDPASPAWADLARSLAHGPDITADFTEQRTFPFRREPVALKGEVRVSAAHGISLRYTAPEERTVVLDERGMLIRSPEGQSAPPPDPRAAAAAGALLNVLHLDLAALQRDFDLYGRLDGPAWALALVPKTEALRLGVGLITVSGDGASVRAINIRRSANQSIEIAIGAPRATPFTSDELHRYFRPPGQ